MPKCALAKPLPPINFDEYHYGAWRDNAKELFEAEGKKEIEFGEGEGID